MEVVLDYGMRLFRHVVSQVFGNLGQAAKITAIPSMVLVALGYFILGSFFAEMDRLASDPAFAELSSQERGQIVGEQSVEILLILPVLLVVFAWVAVAWHRYVLVEEYSGWAPQFSPGRVLGYAWRWLLIILLLILVFIPIAIVAGIILGILGLEGSILINMGASFLLSWMLVRWSLILPAWSIGEKMTIGASWNVTKDVSGEILVPILGFAILFPVVQQVIALLSLGAVSVMLAVVALWIQLLVNLALLTTLYGNLVQGRPLN